MRIRHNARWSMSMSMPELPHTRPFRLALLRSILLSTPKDRFFRRILSGIMVRRIFQVIFCKCILSHTMTPVDSCVCIIAQKFW